MPTCQRSHFYFASKSTQLLNRKDTAHRVATAIEKLNSKTFQDYFRSFSRNV